MSSLTLMLAGRLLHTLEPSMFSEHPYSTNMFGSPEYILVWQLSVNMSLASKDKQQKTHQLERRLFALVPSST